MTFCPVGNIQGKDIDRVEIHIKNLQNLIENTKEMKGGLFSGHTDRKLTCSIKVQGKGRTC